MHLGWVNHFILNNVGIVKGRYKKIQFILWLSATHSIPIACSLSLSLCFYIILSASCIGASLTLTRNNEVLTSPTFANFCGWWSAGAGLNEIILQECGHRPGCCLTIRLRLRVLLDLQAFELLLQISDVKNAWLSLWKKLQCHKNWNLEKVWEDTEK